MNKTEILHYLRTNSKIQDEKLDDLINSCMDEVEKAVSPKTIYKIFPLKVDGDVSVCGDITFKSARLAKTLEGSEEVCIFAATLGTECDRLIRTYSSIDIARTAVLQAVLASKIEEVCDSVEEELKDNGYALTSRYSPGYFDLNIESQRDIFATLDITKRCLITLTDTCQMIPTKSVTAIIGLKK